MGKFNLNYHIPVVRSALASTHKHREGVAPVAFMDGDWACCVLCAVSSAFSLPAHHGV